MDKDTITYEIGYLLNSSLKEEEILSFSEKFRNAITEKGGLILSEGAPKSLTLAYTIKKETNGYFNWLKFMLKPAVLKDITAYLDKQNNVLRYLVIKSKEKSGKISQKPRIRKETSVPKIEEGVAEKPVQPEGVREEEIDKKIEEILGV